MKLTPMVRSDRAGGIERRREVEIDHVAVVLDHAAPIGVGRLDAEAEEAQRRDEQEGEAEAQPELGDQRRQCVGQDLAADDPPQPFAAQPRRLDEFEHDDVHGDGAAQAEDPGRIEDGDGRDQHRQLGAQHRQDDEGEDQRRHRQQEVDDARQDGSTVLLDTAAVKPTTMPMVKERQVMTSERPIDMRAP